MSDHKPIPRLHEQITKAIEHGEVGRAIELQREVEEADPDIGTLIDQFESAVEADDAETARTVTRKIASQLSEKRAEQIETLQRTIHARDQPDTSESELVALQEYIRSITSTSLDRSGFLTAASSLLDEFEERSGQQREEGTATARQLKQSEQTTADAQSSAEETADAKTLPASVELIAVDSPDLTLSVGQSTSIDVQLSNVGDEAAQSIEVTAVASAGLSFDGTRRNLSEVPGGQTVEVGFDLTATEAGEYTVSFEVVSENGGRSTRDVAVSVRASPTGPVENIAGDNRTVEFQEVLEAISLYNQDRPVPGTDGETLTFQDVLRVIALFNGGESV